MTEKNDSAITHYPALRDDTATTNNMTVASSSQPRHYGWLLWLLLIVAIAAAGFYFIWLHGRQLQQSTQTFSTQLTQQAQQLQQIETAQQQNLTQITQQKQQLDQFKQQLSNTEQQKQLLLQLQWLINNAYQQLFAYHNIANSLQLLKESQQLLPKSLLFAPLAQALEQDIKTVSQLSTIDNNQQVTQLTQLSSQVDQLPLPTIATPTNANVTQSTSATTGSWQQRFWQSSQQFLKQFITIEPRNETTPYPLSSEQNAWLKENLRGYLLLACQAIWHQQQSVYQQTLKSAQLLISHYFLVNTPQTKAFLAQLQQLQQQSIIMTLPGQLQSQTAITAWQQNAFITTEQTKE